jgi:hypothetical protein
MFLNMLLRDSALYAWVVWVVLLVGLSFWPSAASRHQPQQKAGR